MQRYDRFTFTATKTDEGFIKDTPIVGRAGLLRYINADGTERIEYRPPEETFDKKSLASLSGKPITFLHLGIANSDNVGDKKTIGTLLSTGKDCCGNIGEQRKGVSML